MMKVRVKNLTLDRDADGIEFGVRNKDKIHLGDLYVTKYGLTWCKGKISRKHGKKIEWDNFIYWMENRSQ